MSPLHVLLVTDASNAAQVLLPTLRTVGRPFEIQSTPRPVALAAIAARDPDLVVFFCQHATDLPAIRTLAEACARAAFLPFAASGDSDEAALETSCVAAGAWAYLPQRHPAPLLAGLHTLLASSQARRAARLRERAALDRFRALADLLPALVWTWDEHRRIQFSNQAWLREMGAAAALTPDWLTLVPDEDRDRLRAALEEPSSVFEDRIQLHGPDGQWRWYSLRTAGRVATATVGAAGKAEAPAAATVPWPGLPSEFRHELNNQLAIIRMFADVLVLTSTLPPSCTAKAREIVAAADQASQLVRRVANPGPPLA